MYLVMISQIKFAGNRFLRGGYNFCTHRLIEVNLLRFEFLSTGTAKLSSLALILSSIVPLFHVFYLSIVSVFIVEYLCVVIPLSAMLWAGVSRWVYLSKEIIFDVKRNKVTLFNAEYPLKNVCALQVLRESCAKGRKPKFRYSSYELNLVFLDKSRLLVVDHSDSAALLDDAEKLSKCLNVPLWLKS